VNYERELREGQAKMANLQNNLNNTLKSVQDLQSQNKLLTHERTALTQKTEDQKQRILALELDKQDLIQQLSQTKQQHQNHLDQTKQQLHQEIQLIQEALND
jgi:hypothetical protein